MRGFIKRNALYNINDIRNRVIVASNEELYFNADRIGDELLKTDKRNIFTLCLKALSGLTALTGVGLMLASIPSLAGLAIFSVGASGFVASCQAASKNNNFASQLKEVEDVILEEVEYRAEL